MDIDWGAVIGGICALLAYFVGKKRGKPKVE